MCHIMITSDFVSCEQVQSTFIQSLKSIKFNTLEHCYKMFRYSVESGRCITLL